MILFYRLLVAQLAHLQILKLFSSHFYDMLGKLSPNESVFPNSRETNPIRLSTDA